MSEDVHHASYAHALGAYDQRADDKIVKLTQQFTFTDKREQGIRFPSVQYK